MKIRNGFVSNSSSSSYIVKIRDTSKEEFAEAMRDVWPYFFYENLMSRLDKDIDFFSKAIEEEKSHSTDKSLRRLLQDINQVRLNELLNLKGRLTEIREDGLKNFDKLVFLVLEYNNLQCEIKDGYISLRSFTSMHNSFNDGMNEVLREIVLTLMFDTKKKLECYREGDMD